MRFDVRRYLRPFFFVGFALVILSSVSLSAFAVATDMRVSPARDVTRALLDAAAAYAGASGTQKDQRLSDLIAISRKRMGLLRALVDTDVSEVLRVTLPANVRSTLPSQALAFMEQETDREGTLEVYHIDQPHPADNRYLHVLVSAEQNLTLRFAGRPPTLLSGTKIRVHGVRIDDVLAVGAGGNVTKVQAASTLSTLGAQKTLAILVNFADEPIQPFTLADAQAMVFTTASNFDYEASYQQTWLTGSVAGWFTIPLSSTTCDYRSIATYAKQAATNAGVKISNFSRYVYVFPANACSWWGMGSVGGNPSEAWIHTKFGFGLPVIGHEMGHNLGLYHSHSLDCGSVAIAATGCSMLEYGDAFDIMGSSNRPPHFNAYQKELLGWLNAGVSPPVITVSNQGGVASYTIEPTETARDGMPRALKIPRTAACPSNSEWFYVESRQAQGFDDFLAGNGNVLGGVLVHHVDAGDGDSSALLDMTPETTSWEDAALSAGLAFTDPVSSLTIMPVSVGTSSTMVSVAFPVASCAHANPSLAVAPQSTVWAPAGTSVSYTISVTNNDNCLCAASEFAVAASAPSGWALTSASTASIAPGATGTALLTITSEATTAPDFYTVGMTATNSVDASFTSSVNATIAIGASFTAQVASDSLTYVRPKRRNQTYYAAITTTVSSGGAPVSGAAVALKIKDAAGTTTTLAGTTDASGTAVASYPIQSVSVVGAYSVTSTVSQAGMSSTATGSFTVQ